MKLIFILFLKLFFFNALKAQVITSSNLPIVIITTDINPVTGQPKDISGNYKILASMTIIYRPDGTRNYLSDKNIPSYQNYNGRIEVKLRGASSQNLQKKAYSLTTLEDDEVTNNNVSILEMPAKNDWILNSMAYDSTLMKDYLTYMLARNLGNYAPRGKYCEVVINGDYKGVYVFMEKIKVDAGRVNIFKMTTVDNTAPAVTGGYITKCDDQSGGDPVAWSFQTNTSIPVNFMHEFPKPAAITMQQHNFIFNEFTSLEKSIQSQNTSVPDGFPSKIDIPTFVDFILLNELASNREAYQFNTYFHKDRNGKLRAGPVWDFNLAYGPDDLKPDNLTDIWQFDNKNNEGATFWKNLFLNPLFKCYLSKRWNELTATGEPLSYTNITNQIDLIANLLIEAKERENTKWGSIGNYSKNISDLKNWLFTRINWIASNLSNTGNCIFPAPPALVISKINYRPISTGGLSSGDLEFIELTNNSPSAIDVSGYYLKELGISYVFPPNSILLPYKNIFLASNSTVFFQAYGFNPDGSFTRNLPNKSQKIVLADPYGNSVDEVEYRNSSPWPLLADGKGYYLKLKKVNYDNSMASSWIASNEALSLTRVFTFTGTSSNNINKLNWQTSVEVNNQLFDIERSKDSLSFVKIGTVAGAGNSPILTNYYFNDNNPHPGINYYRLKQVAINGRFVYSEIISVENKSKGSFFIYPNPVAKKLYITGMNLQNVDYLIINGVGTQLLKGRILTDNSIRVDQLSKGIYFIIINGKALKFFKQ